MGRHIIYLMALDRRPPTAHGRGGTRGGDSPLFPITSRYPLHRCYVPSNRSTIQTPSLRNSHRVTPIPLAARQLLRPPDIMLMATATRRQRSHGAAAAYPTAYTHGILPLDRSTRRHLRHLRSTTPPLITPVQIGQSAVFPTRRTLRHPSGSPTIIPPPLSAFAVLGAAV